MIVSSGRETCRAEAKISRVGFPHERIKPTGTPTAFFAANKSSELGNPTFLYQFAGTAHTPVLDPLEAYHGLDTNYIFDNNLSLLSYMYVYTRSNYQLRVSQLLVK